MLMMRPEFSDELHASINEIKRAGERAAALTNQLLVFSRKHVIQPRVIDLNALISDMEKMLKRLITEDIELQSVMEPVLWRVKADPGQIEQLIMNLVINAGDSMPTGGKLIISTANVYPGEADINQRFEAESGHYIMLSVSDTGHGMDEETMTRIFEPFFTTKELGKGTGLGLSTVYGIVKQSGGDISVESRVGIGTTFKIYLPRVEGDSGNIETYVSEKKDSPGGMRRFLSLKTKRMFGRSWLNYWKHKGLTCWNREIVMKRFKSAKIMEIRYIYL